MTYTVWKLGQFAARFATRDGALSWIQSQGGGDDYEITDESDDT
jgi:hypothetical protein